MSIFTCEKAIQMNVSNVVNDYITESMKMKMAKHSINANSSVKFEPMNEVEVEISTNKLNDVTSDKTSETKSTVNSQVVNTDTKIHHLSIGRIGRILELDRSDLSSDSEPERSQCRRMSFGQQKVIKTRRARFSLDERTRKILGNDDDKTDKQKTHRPRRRRSGVSAEPVRELWNTTKRHHHQVSTDLTIKNIHQKSEEDSKEKQKKNACELFSYCMIYRILIMFCWVILAFHLFIRSLVSKSVLIRMQDSTK